jgi:hypothetical protein
MTDLTAVVRPFITRSTTRTVVLTGDRRRSSDSPEIPYILRNWSNHYRLHKISQFTFFQSPINLAHKIRPHSFGPPLYYLPIYSQFIQVGTVVPSRSWHAVRADSLYKDIRYSVFSTVSTAACTLHNFSFFYFSAIKRFIGMTPNLWMGVSSAVCLDRWRRRCVVQTAVLLLFAMLFNGINSIYFKTQQKCLRLSPS